MTVKAVIGRREGRSEDIKGPYEHRFLFRLGKENQKDKKTTIDVSQAKPGRQYLNIKIEHLSGLKTSDVKGLLGIDTHDGTEVRGMQGWARAREGSGAPGRVWRFVPRFRALGVSYLQCL